MDKMNMEGMEGSERKGREGKCGYDLVLRLLAFVLTLVAAVVIGEAKQTAIVPIKFVDSMPPFHLPVAAKWHYMSAFLYFVVGNAIACAYATVSLLLRLGNRRKGKGKMETLMSVFEAVMVALLFSGNGAAIAVGLLGLQGNSHVHWNKVCNQFDRFCDQVAASLFISLLGSIAFLLLLLIPPLFRLKQTT